MRHNTILMDIIAFPAASPITTAVILLHHFELAQQDEQFLGFDSRN
jgi:hypothetical protein